MRCAGSVQRRLCGLAIAPQMSAKPVGARVVNIACAAAGVELVEKGGSWEFDTKECDNVLTAFCGIV